jgi:hypothetical protein
MSAGEMWTTVQSEVNRADSAMSDAADALRKARQLEAQATAALADAYNMTRCNVPNSYSKSTARITRSRIGVSCDRARDRPRAADARRGRV